VLLPGDPGFDEEHKDALELLNSEFAERLKRQSDSGARVDAKAGVLGGFAVTAMTFQARQTVAHPVLGWLSVGAFGLAFLSAVGSLILVAYQDTAPDKMVGEYVMLDRPAALARLVQLRLRIFERNAVLHSWKVRAWVVSLAFLVAGFALTVGTVVHTGSHGASEGVSLAIDRFWLARWCRWALAFVLVRSVAGAILRRVLGVARAGGIARRRGSGGRRSAAVGRLGPG